MHIYSVGRVPYFLMAFILWLIPVTVFASYPFDTEDLPSHQSPYHAMASYYYFMDEDAGHYNPSVAGMSLRAPSELRGEEAKLAKKLSDIVQGRGLVVDWQEIPRENDYIDTASQEHIYSPFPRQQDFYLERDGGQWKLSRESTEMIPAIHEDIFPFGLNTLVENLPESFFAEFWGLYLWQYFGLVILIILGFGVHRLLSFLLGNILVLFITKAGHRQLALEHVPPLARPLSIWLLVLFLLNFLPALQLPAQFSNFLLTGLYVLAHLMVIVVLYRIVDVFSATYQNIKKAEETSFEKQLKPLLKRVIKTVVIIIGSLFMLQNLNFDITTLLAGISLGGLAFALAAQDTVKNFFGSLVIFTDKPFKVGDWISFSDMDGTVEEVGIRSTRVRTFYNSLVYMPNGKLADMPVDNYGERRYRRFFTTIAITYDTPTILIEKYLEGLRRIVIEHPDTRKDYYNVYLNDFNSSSLDIMFYIFFEVPDWPSELQAREEVMLSTIKLARELGVRFAFPTQTLHMEEFPGKGATTPEYITDNQELDRKLEQFFGNQQS